VVELERALEAIAKLDSHAVALAGPRGESAKRRHEPAALAAYRREVARERSRVLDCVVDQADHVLDVEACTGFFLRELRGNAAEHERDAGQLLPEAIVQVAADALLFAIGDLDDAALEALALRYVVQHREPVIRAAHAER